MASFVVNHQAETMRISNLQRHRSTFHCECGRSKASHPEDYCHTHMLPQSFPLHSIVVSVAFVYSGRVRILSFDYFSMVAASDLIGLYDQTAGRDLYAEEVELRSIWIALIYLTLEKASWPQKVQRAHEISAPFMVRSIFMKRIYG